MRWIGYLIDKEELIAVLVWGRLLVLVMLYDIRLGAPSPASYIKSRYIIHLLAFLSLLRFSAPPLPSPSLPIENPYRLIGATILDMAWYSNHPVGG